MQDRKAQCNSREALRKEVYRLNKKKVSVQKIVQTWIAMSSLVMRSLNKETKSIFYATLISSMNKKNDLNFISFYI